MISAQPAGSSNFLSCTKETSTKAETVLRRDDGGKAHIGDFRALGLLTDSRRAAIEKLGSGGGAQEEQRRHSAER